MPRSPLSQVVTASDLLLGDVVYQTADDGWTRTLTRAEILTDEADAQLRLLDAARQHTIVVGAYLAEIRIDQTEPRPVHFREGYRARGPSNYPHGKQEAAQDV